MIEIQSNGYESRLYRYKLLIDGMVVTGAEVEIYRDTEETLDVGTIITTTEEATEIVAARKLPELRARRIELRCHISWLEVFDNVCVRRSDEGVYSMSIEFNKLSRWRGKNSFAEYFAVLTRMSEFSDEPRLKLILSRDVGDTYGATFIPIFPELPVATELAQFLNALYQLHERANNELNARFLNNSIVLSFDFPEAVKIPCEQYLRYFAQFLRDVGVESTADIQHDAGKVLFSVTPVDENIALDKIRAALEIYLKLPTGTVTSDASITGYEVAVQRLAANIDHLKGQLRLAHAELRLAGATIQTQQIAINHLLSGEVVIDSLKDVAPKPKDDDKEELLGGTIALTKTNWKGLEFNLPEIFRKLRRLFKERK